MISLVDDKLQNLKYLKLQTRQYYYVPNSGRRLTFSIGHPVHMHEKQRRESMLYIRIHVCMHVTYCGKAAKNNKYFRARKIGFSVPAATISSFAVGRVYIYIFFFYIYIFKYLARTNDRS